MKEGCTTGAGGPLVASFGSKFCSISNLSPEPSPSVSGSVGSVPVSFASTKVPVLVSTPSSSPSPSVSALVGSVLEEVMEERETRSPVEEIKISCTPTPLNPFTKILKSLIWLTRSVLKSISWSGTKVLKASRGSEKVNSRPALLRVSVVPGTDSRKPIDGGLERLPAGKEIVPVTALDQLISKTRPASAPSGSPSASVSGLQGSVPRSSSVPLGIPSSSGSASASAIFLSRQLY